ncbi:MAG: hypothetical protein M1546_13745 [Chloroflexi bacterium]|nr:hypothetical protein [Chloroflexota bacterium]
MAQFTATSAASQTPSILIETKPEEMSIVDVKTGPAAATFIAGGVGAAALGIIVPLSEAIPALKTWLTWNAGVGPLAGKTIIPSILFFVVWLVLGLMFRDKNVNLRTSLAVGFVGLFIGLLGTFPPFYDLFTAH